MRLIDASTSASSFKSWTHGRFLLQYCGRETRLPHRTCSLFHTLPDIYIYIRTTHNESSKGIAAIRSLAGCRGQGRSAQPRTPCAHTTTWEHRIKRPSQGVEARGARHSRGHRARTPPLGAPRIPSLRTCRAGPTHQFGTDLRQQRRPPEGFTRSTPVGAASLK